MQLQIDNDILSFSNSLEYEQFWNKVLKQLSSKRRVISEVTIDGQHCTDYSETYIIANFNSINTVSIKTMTENEMLNETMSEICRYSGVLTKSCDSIGSLFYSELNSEGWDMFNQLINGVTWIYEALFQSVNYINLLDQSENSSMLESLQKEVENLNNKLKELNDALDSQEYTLVGDIIKYELKEVFSSIEEILTKRG